jgi:sterol 3beta-glucosyltransferase
MIEQKKLGYHLPFKKLSPEKLLQAINAADDQKIKETCRVTASAIRAEDGLRNAVDLLDTYFSLKS